MTHHQQKLNPHQQSGAILLTSLIFLLVLSMIVLAALRTGTLEERMAANARNRQVALQAAEAVLRNAEVTLFTGSEFISEFDNINLAAGYYGAPAAGIDAKWKTVDWSSATATLTTDETLDLEGVSTAPRYIVEIIEKPEPILGSGCTRGVARITARGMGKDSSTVFVQAMYRYQAERENNGC